MMVGVDIQDKEPNARNSCNGSGSRFRTPPTREARSPSIMECTGSRRRSSLTGTGGLPTSTSAR